MDESHECIRETKLTKAVSAFVKQNGRKPRVHLQKQMDESRECIRETKRTKVVSAFAKQKHKEVTT